MAAVFPAKRVQQELRKSLKQLVSLHEPVLMVEELHAIEIDIQKNRVVAYIAQPVFPVLGQLKEIRKAGQTGKRIIAVGFQVAVGFQDALLVQGDAHGLAQLGSLRLAAVRIGALIHIPDLGEPDPGLRIHMLADGVDHGVIRAALLVPAIDHLQRAALGHKFYRGVGDPGCVVGMNVLVQAILHIMISLRLVRISEQRAEAIRKKNGDHAHIDKLEDGEGLLQSLQNGLLLFAEMVSFHIVSPCFYVKPLRLAGLPDN